MPMMAPTTPGGLLGGYGADPDGINGSWEEECTCVSTSIRVRVAVAAGEHVHHLPQRLFLACPRPASMAWALPEVTSAVVIFCHVKHACPTINQFCLCLRGGGDPRVLTFLKKCMRKVWNKWSNLVVTEYCIILYL